MTVSSALNMLKDLMKKLESLPDSKLVKLVESLRPEELQDLINMCYLAGRRDLARRILSLIVNGRVSGASTEPVHTLLRR